MKMMEWFVGTALAQFGGGTQPSSNFRLENFFFLNPFITNNPQQTLSTLIGRVIGIILTIAAIVAFVYLLIAGFNYITAGGDAAKAQTARVGIVNALIGIVIIIVAYLVLRYVAGFIQAP